MDAPHKHQHQRKFVAAKKAAGLKRLVLWVRPEDKERLKVICRQPHAMARLAARTERHLRPKIESKISARLERMTMRAMLLQRRAQARRRLLAGNRPPELIRFLKKPSGAVRNQLTSAGWLYDPVACVWHLPDDPKKWLDTVRLLVELEKYSPEPFALPP